MATDSKNKAIKTKAKPEYAHDTLHAHWGSGKPLKHEGKKYGVHKMSYGDYFLEPHGSKRGEKDGFHPATKWMKLKDAKRKVYETED